MAEFALIAIMGSIGVALLEGDLAVVKMTARGLTVVDPSLKARHRGTRRSTHGGILGYHLKVLGCQLSTTLERAVDSFTMT